MGEETPVEDEGKDISEIADDLFKDDSTKPESAWFAFNEVGDKIQGKLVMEPYEKEGNFGAQTIYVIETADGKEFNVALKNTTHRMNIQQLKAAEVGDLVAFQFVKEVDTNKGNMAKSIEVRHRPMKK
jgi:hypothetical protein